MNIVFRADASPTIGTGHVIRCLTLADALAKRGLACHFVSREGDGDLVAAIMEHGHRAIALPPTPPTAVDNPYAIDWQVDARQTLAAIAGLTPAWLIVDHYGIDSRWEQLLRPAAAQILVIDDLADRPHDCDLLLDQTVDADRPGRYDRLVPQTSRKRLGAQHVMLRPEFDLSPRADRRSTAGKLHVYFGSNDRSNQTGKVVEALADLRELSATVILGHAHPFAEQVIAMARHLQHVDVHHFDRDIARSMQTAGLGIGVCGMAAWERCAASLPSLVTMTAENQRADALALQRIGALEIVGEAERLTARDWREAIRRLVADAHSLEAMGQAAYGAVAGHARNFAELVELVVSNVR